MSLKVILRRVGIEPPKFHDVGSLLVEHKDKLQGIPFNDIKKIANISKKLRKERELSFYGDIDFIPTEEYKIDDATESMQGANFVVSIAKKVIG